MFLICYLDPRCAGKILPVFGNDAKALIQIIGGPQGHRVYDPAGVACTQTAGGGGLGVKTGLYFVGFNRKEGIVGERDMALPLNASDFRGINRNQTQNAVFVDLCAGQPEQTENARCLTAQYGRTTLCNHRAERSGVLLIKEAAGQNNDVAAPADTAGPAGSQPQNAVFVDLCKGHPVITSTAHCINTRQDALLTNFKGQNSGVLFIKEGTKQGYKEAAPGDSVDLGYPGSTTRGGRVSKLAHDAASVQGIVERGGRIRRLMPRECLRLQGFDEDQIDRLLAITSDAQAYKQAGNSVTVNVIEAIGRRIRAVDEVLKKEDAA